MDVFVYAADVNAGRNRGLPTVAFVTFAYAYSLAAAQALFFALIILTPPSRREHQRYWMPHPAVGLPMVLAYAAIVSLPQAYARLKTDTPTLYIVAPAWFNLLQGYLIVCPIVVAWALKVKHACTSRSCTVATG